MMIIPVFLSVSLSESDQHWVYSVSLLLFHCQITPQERQHQKPWLGNLSRLQLMCVYSGLRLFMMTAIQVHWQSACIDDPGPDWNGFRPTSTPESRFNAVSKVMPIVWTG